MFSRLTADFPYNCTIGLDVSELITHACKGMCMNCLESYCIQMYEQQDLLIEEQNITEQNLCNKACDILCQHV